MDGPMKYITSHFDCPGWKTASNHAHIGIAIFHCIKLGIDKSL